MTSVINHNKQPSSFAMKAAVKAVKSNPNSISDSKKNTNIQDQSENHYQQQQPQHQQQIDKVVESVANASKRLSQSSTVSNSKRKAENRIGPWRLGRTLGRGSTGRVRLAKHSVNGQLSAVKIVPKISRAGNGSQQQQHQPPKIQNKSKVDANGLPYGIEREIIIMKLISHTNIMALYDVWENESELYLVLEYVEGGELFDYLISHGKLSEQEAVGYFRQIIKGVEYCHRFNICHRDLKPENILLDKNHNIKIADFGMAALETTQKLLETSCGSPHYASPEIVAGRNYHGSPSDVWSCGIILFALMTGHLPFDDPNIRKLLLKVQAGKFYMPSGLSSEAKDLIWSMLRVDPKDRVSIHSILSHPLLKKYPDPDAIETQRALNFDLSRPINRVDPGILHNLQTLWHGIPTSEITKKLRNNDKNSEKMFYHLLAKYKSDHIDGEDESDGRNKRNKSRVSHTATKSHGSSSHTSPPSTIPRSTSIIKTTIQDENGLIVRSSVKEIPLTAHSSITHTQQPPQQLPSLALKKRQPLKKRSKNSMNVQSNQNRTAFGVTASSSVKKSVSFNSKNPLSSHNSVHSNISRKANTGLIGRAPLSVTEAATSNPKDLPKLPEVDLSEFKYLVDTIFESNNKLDMELKKIDNNKNSAFNFNIHRDETLDNIEITDSSLSETKKLTTEDKLDLTVRNMKTVKAALKTRQPSSASSSSSLISKPHSKTLGSNDPNSSFASTINETHSSAVSSLDPKRTHKKSFTRTVSNTSSNPENSDIKTATSATSRNVSNASSVLEKFGVRMSRLDNFGKLQLPLAPSVAVPSPPSSLFTSEKSDKKLDSLKKSQSSSSRNLSSFLNTSKDISLAAYNTRVIIEKKAINPTPPFSPRPVFSAFHAPPPPQHNAPLLPQQQQFLTANGTSFVGSHKTDKSFDYSLIDYDASYSLHSAIQVPMMTPTEEQFIVLQSPSSLATDKFADADEQKNFLYTSLDSNSNKSEIKLHRKAESTSTEDSQVNKPSTSIRCSLLANSNYDIPEGSEDQDKVLNLTPEKKRYSGIINKNLARSSVFEDPEEDDEDVANDVTIAREYTTIFDDEPSASILEDNYGASKLVDTRNQRISKLSAAEFDKRSAQSQQQHPHEYKTMAPSSVFQGIPEEEHPSFRSAYRSSTPPTPALSRRASVKERIISLVPRSNFANNSNVDMSPTDPVFTERTGTTSSSIRPDKVTKKLRFTDAFKASDTVEIPEEGAVANKRPNWFKRLFSGTFSTTSFNSRPADKQTIKKSKKKSRSIGKKNSSIFQLQKKHHVIESDILSSLETISHLRSSLSQQDTVTIKLLGKNPATRIQVLLIEVNNKNLSFKIEVEDYLDSVEEDDDDFAFNGCFIKLSKVEGGKSSNKLFKVCCDAVETNIRELEKSKRPTD